MGQGLYLGREVDPGSKAQGAPLRLDPNDLLTHGLIVGMTGSGKTGLAIALIEEVLRQGVPVVAIDPKGDLGNLRLLFEEMTPAAFEPWIDADAARREGRTVAEEASLTAARWSKGLAEWGLGPEDVRALRASHEGVVYTPGSRSGRPLNVLQSLEAPKVPFASAEEDLREEIAGFVAGLLGLLHLDADPLQSRESVLLANLIEEAWRAGRSLTLEALVTQVVDPPLERLGALPLETVFPRKEREGLMRALNNLLAAPSFGAWREGDPLDVERLLRAADGRPRLSIVYTAHLSDEERLFVTALLLDKIKTWMRRQGGTSQLRALVYMDEIFGYFPPHPGNPPTKRPLLTLLKQARAQGVGVVLATQNPVDLDYKGLANMGLWAVGRLQTDRDRERLREGLLGAGGLDAAGLDRLLDATGKRVFLLHDVHRPAPCLFHTRWAMSYLRGPLTRDEVARLASDSGAPAASVAPAPSAAGLSAPPPVPAPLRHHYFPAFGGELAEPHVLVKYAVRYKDAGERIVLRAWPLSGAVSAAEVLEGSPTEVDESRVGTSAPALRHGELPAFVLTGGARALEKALRERLPDKLAVAVHHDPVTKVSSAPGEDVEAFAARLTAESGGAPAVRLREKVARKRRDLDQKREELQGRTQEKWLAVGAAVLRNIGLVTGKKRTISGAETVLSKNRMENNAESRVEALEAELASLEAELASLENVDPGRFERREIVPSRGDVKLLRYDLLWIY
jgi:DNA helicase HerA-like ATPase